MPTPSDIASQMVQALALSEPELDTGVGTPIRKMLDTVSEAIAESHLDRYLLSYSYDIDSRNGADLDAFTALFGFRRLVARSSSGTILLQRSTPATQSIVVPAGAQASNGDSAPVIVRTTSPAVFPRGATFLEIPAHAVIGGSVGNLPASSVIRWLTPVDGISSVTNPAPFTGGSDAESDAQFRERFKKTVFRNLAGTQDMYTAIAQADQSVTSVEIYGTTKRWTERVEVVSGVATPSVASTIESFAISNATNATPITISTITPHGMNQGDYVYISGVGGNTAANGFRRIYSVPTERSFSLISATSSSTVAGSGAYTSGGTVVPVIRMQWIDPTTAQVHFGPNIDLGQVHPRSLYTFSSTVVPATVTVADVEAVPDGIYDLSFLYSSQGSRNVPGYSVGRLLDRVDVWVDGSSAETASVVSILDGENALTAGPGNFGTIGVHRRPDGSRVASGNLYIEVPFAPIITLPATLTVGTATLDLGTDYWIGVQETQSAVGGSGCRDIIEVSSAAVQTGLVNITSSTNATPIVLTIPAHSFAVGQRVRVDGHTTNTNANGDFYVSAVGATTITLEGTSGNGVGGASGTVKLYHPVGVQYDFNVVPYRISREVESWRLVASNLMVHKARPLPLRIFCAVILQPGWTLTNVQTAVDQAASELLASLGIGSVMQISDLLNAIGDVSGVDSVRMLNSSDVSSKTVLAATNATPIVLTLPTGHGIVQDDMVYVEGLVGNTAGNGVWQVQAVGATTVTLMDSAGNGVWSSGGTVTKANFGIQIMSRDGTMPMRLAVNRSATPHRAVDIPANDNEHFTLHSVVLSHKSQSSWGVN